MKNRLLLFVLIFVLSLTCVLSSCAKKEGIDMKDVIVMKDAAIDVIAKAVDHYVECFCR